MEARERPGRTIGILIFLQMLGSGLVNFALEAPLSGSPGFLTNAALHPYQLGLAVVLGLMTEALWLGIAIAAFPNVYPRSKRLMLWFLALAGVILAITVVESIGVMSMLSVSQAYARATHGSRAQLDAVGVIVSSVRDWAHILVRLAHGAALLAFYSVLYRCALIPSPLAGVGLIAAISLVVGIGMPLFGYDVAFPLLAPMGVSQLLLALWLIAKDFRSAPGLPGAGRLTTA